MLKEPADKFHDTKAHCPPAVTFGFFVPKEYFSVFNFNYATVRYGNFKNIRREVFDTFCAIANCLTVNIPGKRPNF